MSLPPTAPPGGRPELLRADPGQRRLVLLLLALGALPLLWPSFPPLIDLPNHMSRYRIGLDYATSPYFRRWFDFHWVLVGNLGVDLLVQGLAPIIGLEPATKLVILATPVIAISGVALIAREAHGRVPRTAAFAAVFAYNYPFNFGFVNFTLAAALALVAFGLWIRLGRLGWRRGRLALFVPIGFIVWLAHVAGWGVLGILVFTWELADARTCRIAWPRATGGAVIACLPLCLPLLPMLLWSARIPHESLALFNPNLLVKVAFFFYMLRNGSQNIDILSVVAVIVAAITGLIRRDLGYDRRLAFAGWVLFAVFVAMPTNLMGSGFADLRIAPYAMMLFLVALRPTVDTEFTRGLGIAALVFFAAHMAWHAARYAAINRAQEHALLALDHLPRGSTVFGYASVACSATMEGTRMDHIHRLAIVRREAFTNGTWPYPASQTLIVHPDMIAGYRDESSQLLQPPQCRQQKRNMVRYALASIPRDRYRYFWMLDTPRRLWPTRTWLRPVWHNDRTILYAIAPPGRERGWKRTAAERTPARLLPIPE